jgi:uncharacterized membrane protein YdjX (TVP38/TMEM64 family)
MRFWPLTCWRRASVGVLLDGRSYRDALLASYMLATAIGIVPGSFVCAYAGRQLGGLNSMADIPTPGVLLAFTLLGLLALAPVLYRRLRFESIKRE